VACAVVDGRPVVVTASNDTWVRVWDLATGAPVGEPLAGYDHLPVRAVACAVADGRPVAVTASNDTWVRVWDLATGALIGWPLDGHTDTVRAVACSVLDGRPIAVTAGDDASVRVWDLTTRTCTDVTPMRADALAVIGDQLIITSGPDIALLHPNPRPPNQT
jgi:WD40 repeat protein